MMIKRIAISGLSAVAAFSLIAPSFAYFLEGRNSTNRISRRSVHESVRASNNLGRGYKRTRRDPAKDDPSRQMLQRSEARRFRRINRSPKQGHDRYRILNRSQLRINTRWLRLQNESLLPRLLVQTGGMDYSYDRPSRRSIIDTAYVVRGMDRN